MLHLFLVRGGGRLQSLGELVHQCRLGRLDASRALGLQRRTLGAMIG
jgi:hypothetical protein